MDDDFATYVEQVSKRLVRAAWVLTAPLQRDAEDVVQDALVAVMKHWDDLSTDRHARDTYVYKTLVRTARRHARRAYFRRVVLTDRVPESAVEDDKGEMLETIALRAVLASLPQRQREAVVLHYGLDVSVDRTADIMACSVGTVKSQLAKARSAIASEFSSRHDLGLEKRC